MWTVESQMIGGQEGGKRFTGSEASCIWGKKRKEKKNIQK